MCTNDERTYRKRDVDKMADGYHHTAVLGSKLHPAVPGTVCELSRSGHIRPHVQALLVVAHPLEDTFHQAGGRLAKCVQH